MTRSIAAVALALAAPAALGVAACGGGSSSPAEAVDSGGADGGAGGDAADATAVPTPIRHVVVLLKENRTFDAYFTGFPGADTTTEATLSTGDVIARPPPPDKTTCDVPHDYTHALDAYDQGKLDHFDRGLPPCDAEPLRPFYAYPESRIPNYWQYARNFALSDRFFSTVNGPSTPGHLAIVAGWSPAYENPRFCLDSANCGCIAPEGTVIPTFDPATCATSDVYPCFDIPSIVDALPAGFTWTAYGSGKGSHSESTFNFIKSIGADQAVREAHARDLGQLMDDLGTDQQANLVYAFVGPAPISEGPPDDPCAGEGFTVQAVNKVMNSPLWADSLVVLTWDDWGGNYDHVPPKADLCPDGKTFFGPGFRLPLLLVSPYAKAAVLHTPTEQASIPRLIEDLWGMPRMAAKNPNARDERAGSLLEGLDFTQPPRPPLVLTPRTCP